MARKTKRNKRRRKGRFAAFYRVLCFVLIVAALAAAAAVFFKAEHLEVSGNSRYSDQDVIRASGIEQGSNLYAINKYKVAGQITSALPYVESVKIYRRLPDTLCMEVEECSDLLAIRQDGKDWLMSYSGKLVEEKSASENDAVVTGLPLLEPQTGKAVTDEEHTAVLQQLLELAGQMHAKGMLGDVQQIHLEDPRVITLRYLDRFQVELPWNADFDYKLDFLMAVVEKLEDYEKGTLKLTEDGEAHFIME